ncbi:MAG: S8 family peptidase [Candidatus Aenigmatarchaeota archaeon]
MGKYLTIFVGILAVSLYFVNFVFSSEPTRKIVVFQTAVNEAAKDELIKRVGGVKLKNLDLIGARAVWLPNKAAVEKLASDPRVLRIDDDVIVEALGQTLTWNIDRVDAELVWPTGNTADPVKVGVLDTGISNRHPDLTPNVKGGYNAINPLKSWNDDNGHGSHVAGIIAALNNDIGVVGVGPSIDLYAIKVLNAAGSGYLSDVIEGIQWAVQNNMQVLNMSLGTSQDVQSLHDAIIQAYNTGIVLVGAAGNNGGSVIYPAAYPEVIAVSATDQNDQIASWSSRGQEIDLAAPGVSIYSTYKGNKYATLSGTSMAAPHVSGVAALVLNTPVGTNDLNGNGKWDPDEVKTKLCQGAIDLGTPGIDNLYGCGLVNAYKSVQ